jgi:hypothetical protein
MLIVNLASLIATCRVAGSGHRPYHDDLHSTHRAEVGPFEE